MRSAAKRMGLLVTILALTAAVGMYLGMRRAELRRPAGATLVLAMSSAHAPVHTDAH